MKTKNLIFKFLAVIIAVGGAVVSINASFAPGLPHLSYVTVGGSGFCTTICSTNPRVAGSHICKIRVLINSVPTVITAWDHRSTPGPCLVRFTHQTPTVLTCMPGGKTIPAGSTILN